MAATQSGSKGVVGLGRRFSFSCNLCQTPSGLPAAHRRKAGQSPGAFQALPATSTKLYGEGSCTRRVSQCTTQASSVGARGNRDLPKAQGDEREWAWGKAGLWLHLRHTCPKWALPDWHCPCVQLAWAQLRSDGHLLCVNRTCHAKPPLIRASMGGRGQCPWACGATWSLGGVATEAMTY